MNFFLFSLLGVTQLLSLGIPLGQWHLQPWLKAQSRGIFNIHQWPGERMQEMNHLSPLKAPLPPVNRNNCHPLVFFQPLLVKVWPGVCCVSVCDFVFQTVPEGAWVLPCSCNPCGCQFESIGKPERSLVIHLSPPQHHIVSCCAPFGHRGFVELFL